MSTLILTLIKTKDEKLELALAKEEGTSAVKTFTGLAGGAILPVGGYLAAELTIAAGLAGGAAVTATLAALGPFGMIGGLGMIGGMAIGGYMLGSKIGDMFEDDPYINTMPACNIAKQCGKTKSELIKSVKSSKIPSKYHDRLCQAIYKQWGKV